MLFATEMTGHRPDSPYQRSASYRPRFTGHNSVVARIRQIGNEKPLADNQIALPGVIGHFDDWGHQIVVVVVLANLRACRPPSPGAGKSHTGSPAPGRRRGSRDWTDS